MLRSPGSEEAPLVVVGILGVSVVVGAVAVALNHLSFDQWSGILTLTVLV